MGGPPNGEMTLGTSTSDRETRAWVPQGLGMAVREGNKATPKLTGSLRGLRPQHVAWIM